MKEENIFNIRLLREIEKYPYLYNYNLAEYTSREITERAWTEIGEKFKKTPDECKIRWKNLRGSLTRNISQRLKSPGKTPKTFYLTKYMQFVLPFAKSKQARKAGLPCVTKYIMEIKKEPYGYSYDALSAEVEGSRTFETILDDNKEETSKDSWSSIDAKDNIEFKNNPIEFFEETFEECNEPNVLQKTVILNKSNPVPSTSTAVAPVKDPLETPVDQTLPTDHYDADKHFLLSLLPHLHCLTPAEKLQFQIKTLNVINEIMNAREKV